MIVFPGPQPDETKPKCVCWVSGPAWEVYPNLTPSNFCDTKRVFIKHSVSKQLIFLLMSLFCKLKSWQLYISPQIVLEILPALITKSLGIFC